MSQLRLPTQIADNKFQTKDFYAETKFWKRSILISSRRRAVATRPTLPCGAGALVPQPWYRLGGVIWGRGGTELVI